MAFRILKEILKAIFLGKIPCGNSSSVDYSNTMDILGGSEQDR